MKKLWKFVQNNSGGYYIGPQYYYVWAETAAEATARLVSKTWYNPSYCECCGERWWSPSAIDNPHEELPFIEVIDDYCIF